MDPTHDPSPDDPNRHPQTDKPKRKPKAGDQPAPPTGEHGKIPTDPMVRPPSDPDSAVDLGLPGAPTNHAEGDPNSPPPSGNSVVEWAALVEGDPPTDTGSDPKID